MDKKYPELVDLGQGSHILEFKPKPEFKDGQIVPGSHKKGTSKFGNWYMYSTKVGETWYNAFANDENKAIFDSGKVEVVVRPKKDRDGEEVYKKNAEGKIVPELSVFFNEVKESQAAAAESTGQTQDEGLSEGDELPF